MTFLRASTLRTRRCAMAAVTLLTALVALHVYWALGGSWAAGTLSGGAEVPPAGVIWTVALALVLAVAVMLVRAGLWSARYASAQVVRTAAWGVVGAFALATLSNLTSGDTWSMAISAPVSALILLLTLVVALRRPGEAGLSLRPRFRHHAHP